MTDTLFWTLTIYAAGMTSLPVRERGLKRHLDGEKQARDAEYTNQDQGGSGLT